MSSSSVPKNANPSSTSEPEPGRTSSPSNKSEVVMKPVRQPIITLAVLVVAILLAFSGGRYVRTSIHEWVDQMIRNVLLPISENSNTESVKTTPTIWTITPDSTGLKVDAAMYENLLGSQRTMLAEPPPEASISSNSNSNNCVYIFLEVTPKTPNADMHPDWANDKHCRIMAMANTDQFTTHMLDVANLELILCKTRQCVEWIQEKQQDRPNKIPILYTGFSSRPPPIPSEAEALSDDERFQKFLHVAGQSPHKGTWNILQAWLEHPHWPQLTLTSYKNQMVDVVLQQLFQQSNIQELPSNIHHKNEKLPQDELDRLLHTHGVHLCLSGMEGFGHYLNEARAVGALTLATDYPAMNEIITAETGILLDPTNMLEWTNGLPFGNVGAPELARVMNQVVLPMSIEERKALGEKAKEAFARDRDQFEQRMSQFQCYIQKCDDAKTQQSCAEGCGLTLE